MNNILQFEDALMKATGTKHLLLGNGFSVAFAPDMFNYKSLSDELEPREKEIFKRLNTYDFEEAIRYIDDLYKGLKAFEHKKGSGVTPSQLAFMKNESRIIKEALIKAVEKHHPDKPEAISEVQAISCMIFLQKFTTGKIYSLNYDLLLYWVTRKAENYPKFISLSTRSDGFRTPTKESGIENVVWDICYDYKQSINYPHGAMHLFNNVDLEKITYKGVGFSLKEQISRLMEEKKYPLFISAGTNQEKKKLMNKSAYLARALKSMGSIGNNLFIFGHSLNENDYHIFDILFKKSKLQHVFISIFRNDPAILNATERLKQRYPNLKNGKIQIHLFDAESTHVWDNEEEASKYTMFDFDESEICLD